MIIQHLNALYLYPLSNVSMFQQYKN